MKILFLDDDKARHEYARERLIGHDARHVETAAAAIKALREHGPFDVAFLDHDLGGQQHVPSGLGTGYEVAEFITQMAEDERPRSVVVHSYNAPGARMMVAALFGAHVPACWAPFGPGTFRAGLGPKAVA